MDYIELNNICNTLFIYDKFSTYDVENIITLYLRNILPY